MPNHEKFSDFNAVMYQLCSSNNSLTRPVVRFNSAGELIGSIWHNPDEKDGELLFKMKDNYNHHGVFHIIAHLHKAASKKNMISRYFAPDSESAIAGRYRDTLLHYIKEITGRELNLSRLLNAVNRYNRRGRDYKALGQLYYQFASSCATGRAVSADDNSTNLFRRSDNTPGLFERIYNAIYNLLFSAKIEPIERDDNAPKDYAVIRGLYKNAAHYIKKSGGGNNLTNLACSAVIFKNIYNDKKSIKATMDYLAICLLEGQLLGVNARLPDGSEQRFNPIDHLLNILSARPNAASERCKQIAYYNRGAVFIQMKQYAKNNHAHTQNKDSLALQELIKTVKSALQEKTKKQEPDIQVKNLDTNNNLHGSRTKSTYSDDGMLEERSSLSMYP